jgi:hypothetical protein
MTALRAPTLLHRIVLVWWLLSMAVAFASPIVQPRNAERVCTVAGFVYIDLQTAATESDSLMSGSGSADCPMCLVPGIPPIENKVCIHMQARPLGRSLESIPAARLAAQTAAPLPARGPPLRT